MRVAILSDPGNADGSIGGAELTMGELADSTPEGVELVDNLDCDRVVLGNITTFGPALVDSLKDKPVVWFHHDLSPHNHPELKGWLDENATHTFCSSLHRDRYGIDGHLVPPPVDLSRFQPPRNHRRHGTRGGAVAVGAWQNPGKGQQLLIEWAHINGPLDVFGTGPLVPFGPDVAYKGPVAYESLPALLWGYKTFVHLPTDPEPFGRSVIEAWAAGCRIVTNRNVGAVEWFGNPRLDTAADDFWEIVSDA